jgi:hypothetical protein
MACAGRCKLLEERGRTRNRGIMSSVFQARTLQFKGTPTLRAPLQDLFASVESTETGTVTESVM